jgi:hypothetical protein
MSPDHETNTHLPNPPTKLADRINDQSSDLNNPGFVIGNGDIELYVFTPIKRPLKCLKRLKSDVNLVDV